MRGRKPGTDNVVPMTGDTRLESFEAAAKAKAAQLKPAHLEGGAGDVWDRLAPILCNPTVDRLQPQMVETCALMCQVLARYEGLRGKLADPTFGETYASHTRNGVQHKSRPEVAQMNEAFRQFVTLARDFGLTPAAERGLRNAGQGKLPFDERDFD